MTVWDLSRLRYTVRKITGKFDTNQLPDNSPGPGLISVDDPPGIDDYINDFYLYDMPEHLRTLSLRDFYTFTTIPNCGTYNVPENIIQIYNPVYVDAYQSSWHQYPDQFYQIWPEFNFIDQNLFTPDGNKKNFDFTLTQTPVQQGTVVIGLQPNVDGTPSQPLETFTDSDQPIPLDIPVKQYFVNPGTLTGSNGGTGTIDYLTGAVSITYGPVASPVAPPSGTNSSCHYHPYVASRPRDILFWQQQLFLRPIPNDTYKIKVMAYMMPTTVMSAATNAPVRPSLVVDPTTTTNSAPTNTTVTVSGFGTTSPSTLSDLPQINEWWQLIAYGAALKIFIEEGDHEEYARNEVYFEKQKLLAQRKTLKQLGSQRIPTVYSESNVGASQFPVYPIY